MKQKMLLWLYKRLWNKPAVPFTPRLIANAINQPLEKVKQAFAELEEAGAIKKASKLHLDNFRMTLIGLITARKLAEAYPSHYVLLSTFLFVFSSCFLGFDFLFLIKAASLS